MVKSYEITVLGSAVWVRTGPGLNYKTIKLIYKGEKIISTEKKRDWFKHNKGGWSSLYDNGNSILKIDKINQTDDKKDSKKPVTKHIKKKTKEEIEKEKEDLYWRKQRGSFDEGYTPYLTESDDISKRFIRKARGIHGLPYQYMSSVDKRLPGSDFGRKYAEKIITRMPLLLLSPGRPKFMKGYSDSDKKTFLKGIVNDAKGIAEKLVNEKDGKLYSFEYNYDDYYKYVNSALSKMSRYLGIDKKSLYGQVLGHFKWDTFTNSEFRNFISSKESVAFYLDSETQISESFGNSVGESLLSGKINEASEMGQELQYLLGGFGGATGKLSKQFDKLKSENYDKTLKEFEKFTSKYKVLLPENLINSVSGGLLTVISGGKMMFPEIWKDSEFSRSYNISMKLRTPDVDNLSWFLNIGVPLMHLVAFVAPQQMGHNGYRSPFLVRGYYKGFFNCNMGMITSMDITKGDKARWSLNGLPSEIDINFTIKDLYSILMLSIFQDNILECFSNTAMLDYIANLCGININKPDIRRAFDLYFLKIDNKLSDLLSFNRFMGVQNALTNLSNTLY